MMDNSQEKPWWLNSVIYELYVDKFAGNFKGLTEKLDYFNYLGINTLWILPHYPSPFIDGGYDISDYNSIRSELGSLDDFDEFINAAHKKRLKVVLDLVLNHTSDKHPWFIQSSSSRINNFRDWYLWSSDTNKFIQAFVHFAEIKKNGNWIYNEQTDDYYYASFYPQQPDLNWNNPNVYEAMFKIIDFWLSRGVDGFRLDAVSRLIKKENTNCFALKETHEIIKKLRLDISSKFPETVLIAESGGWPSEAKGFFGNGDECQLVINFPLAVNILSVIMDNDLTEVKKVWSESGGIPEQCRWGIFLTNHDSVDLFFLTNENKRKIFAHHNNLMSKYGNKDGSSFAVRLHEICNGKSEKILWAFKQMLEFFGTPIIYYGNEIGMANQKLSSQPFDYREYVRGNFDWKEAEIQIRDENSLLNGVRTLIKNRIK